MSGPGRQVAAILPQFPPSAPEPVPGCTDCARYLELAKSANQGGDFSAATDLRVLMARHRREAH